MKTNVQDTSVAAYRALPVKQLATQAERIATIVSACRSIYGGDLSLKEIKNSHKRLYGDIELSTVSARVNALVAAGRLERLETTRKCSISNISIHPVRVPLQ